MRRQLYLSFGIVLLLTVTLLLIWHAPTFLIVLLLSILLCIFVVDIFQTTHAVRRNFPVLGNIRYILEFFRPEIQQYFIASDTSEKPFDRETRSLIYQRAKKQLETLPFGTRRDLYQKGVSWIQHSLQPIDLHEVNTRTSIGNSACKKPYSASLLNISAMSFGALSQNAILALNQGAKLGNFAHNTGEGGLSPHHLAGGGDIIWQIGTGYFGCRNKDGNFDADLFKEKALHPQVKMIEVKLSQGAKPAHGGILPAAKITSEIAEIRHVPLGEDVLSPPYHTAFNSPTGLIHFISQLRELSEGKPVGFKLCLGKRKEFLGICKAMLEAKIYPDFITVDGAEGGTGAAPVEFSNHVGAPLKEGLWYVHNALIATGLREHIKIIASGKVATGFDMLKLMALGADTCNAARAFMLSLGCIQSLQCHSNTCPTGIATQNKRLMRGLVVQHKNKRVQHFHQGTLHSFCELMGAMGKKSSEEISSDDVFCRNSEGKITPLSELFVSLSENSLLNSEETTITRDWQLASSERF